VKRKPRIAIVEFSPVHDLSFAVIAKAAQALGGQLDIYAPNKLLDQTAILPGNVHRMRIGKGWGAGTVPAIVCRILAGGYDAVWVNTAHGPRARSLLASLKCLMPWFFHNSCGKRCHNPYKPKPSPGILCCRVHGQP
jgi:hypothetical protein